MVSIAFHVESVYIVSPLSIQSTAVLSYRPNIHERPLSCSLQSLEVFSCSLAAENETAMSIIDPMIVTMELNGTPLMQQRTHGGPAGLADATEEEDKPPVMEVLTIVTSKVLWITEVLTIVQSRVLWITEVLTIV